jgi:hypothetical protein
MSDTEKSSPQEDAELQALYDMANSVEFDGFKSAIKERDEEHKSKGAYRFKFKTYFSDDSGYALVDRPHAPITVISDSQKDALKKVFAAFEGAKYGHGWTLKASLLSADEIEEARVEPT